MLSVATENKLERIKCLLFFTDLMLALKINSTVKTIEKQKSVSAS
jgi:hypothetical protein